MDEFANPSSFFASFSSPFLTLLNPLPLPFPPCPSPPSWLMIDISDLIKIDEGRYGVPYEEQFSACHKVCGSGPMDLSTRVPHAAPMPHTVHQHPTHHLLSSRYCCRMLSLTDR